MNRIEFNHMHRIHKQIWWQVERAFKEWSQFSGVVGKSHDLLMEQMRPIKLKRIALDNLVLCGELSKEECVELKIKNCCACCLVSSWYASLYDSRCSVCPVKEWRENIQCIQYNKLVEDINKFAYVMEDVDEQDINIQKYLHEKYRKRVIDDIKEIREIPWVYDEELYGYGGEDEVGWDD